MKRNWLIIILAVLCFGIAVIPIKINADDGGSISYKAILYSVTKYHSLNQESITGYNEGIGIEILGIEVFNNSAPILKSEGTAEGITAEVLNADNEGISFVINDNTGVSNVYGSWYRIDKQNKNGDWNELPTVIDDYGFNDLGIMAVEGETKIPFDIDWVWLYGKLPEGKYRIVKELGTQKIYIPFEI